MRDYTKKYIGKALQEYEEERRNEDCEDSYDDYIDYIFKLQYCGYEEFQKYNPEDAQHEEDFIEPLIEE